MFKLTNRSSHGSKRNMRSSDLSTILISSLCLIACISLLARPVEGGRLQDFIQNLVGGGNSNNNSNNSNGNTNSNSNSNSNNDSNDSDSAAAGDSSNEQNLTPMMSAMSPFMRYPSFYDNFGASSYGGFPGYSFTNPMSAMSSMSPMASMSGSSFGSAFPSSSFGPMSFGTFGSSSTNPISAFSGTTGMSASSLNNVYANSPGLMAYTPYYGKRK